MARTVGIITLHRAHNFGAVLQAFALQHTIKGLGHSCAIIDYVPSSPFIVPPGPFLFPKNLNDFKYDLRTLQNLRSRMTLRERFAGFRSNRLALTSNPYHKAGDFACPEFDALITGSDQVWHPNGLGGEEGQVFFLGFSFSGRRIAYAPSFGVDEIPSPCFERMGNLIRNFDFLSAREKSGCRIIRELTGREAEHVLDPTLLLPAAEYGRIAAMPSQKAPFLLVYLQEYSKEILDLAGRTQSLLKLPIVVVTPPRYDFRDFKFADKVVRDAGPAEFLGWIKHASAVCTNSFHGIIFSLIYKKTFLSVPRFQKNDRLHDLLERAGLLSRQLTDPVELRAGDPLLGPIDYAPVELRLQEAKERSLAYLKRALA